ncbi:unnamed protein product [Darwinula stevensoni]|uniref:Neutral ceramidase n=1 Tax=Darwinula stevensoni TaxID=69355 RepID=A0A7R8XD90_9CRUS|nr:unnamed protein product [Darwinula stevensoni]CAG0892813.1 unnamed protein product [Darwinula stevensoni]
MESRLKIARARAFRLSCLTERTLQGATMECLKFVIGTFLLLLLLSAPARCDEDGLFRIGVGIADCTGPAAGIGFILTHGRFGIEQMGYANPSQTGAGIHTRQFSRAYIICDDPGECLVFVIADIGMMDTAVKTQVVRRLQEEFGGIYHQENVILSGTHTHSGTAGFLQYLLFQITNLGFSEEAFDAYVDGMVNESGELVISGGDFAHFDITCRGAEMKRNADPKAGSTFHEVGGWKGKGKGLEWSHNVTACLLHSVESIPSGIDYWNYFLSGAIRWLEADRLASVVDEERILALVSSMDFRGRRGFKLRDSICNYSPTSVRAAHGNLQPGHIYYNEGELLEANINRSPISYLNNPPEERAQYEYDVDKGMQLLRFESVAGDPLALLTWFPVHSVSMNNTNKLISGDNKGVAAMIVEAAFNPGALPGKGSFVGGFASSNLGDVSPNIKGPRCIDTGEPCDPVTSACGGSNKNCIAFGPGDTMEESTWIIGERQANKALELFEDTANLRMVTGTVKYVHQFVDMTNVTVERLDIFGHMRQRRTCKPAMGYSFAAGCMDGAGMFDFTQGETDSNPFWNFVTDWIQDPTPEQIACHAPKPILIDTGEVSYPECL